jgi:putative N-acetylmannosamine-6-phosphate epimerase
MRVRLDPTSDVLDEVFTPGGEIVVVNATCRSRSRRAIAAGSGYRNGRTRRCLLKESFT